MTDGSCQSLSNLIVRIIIGKLSRYSLQIFGVRMQNDDTCERSSPVSVKVAY